MKYIADLPLSMAPATQRDKVWNQALRKAFDGEEFGTRDIEKVWENSPAWAGDAPSRRTIRNVLNEMQDMGWLERNAPNGHYWSAGPQIQKITKRERKRLDPNDLTPVKPD